MIRFSHQSNSWQALLRTAGEWININPATARILIDDGWLVAGCFELRRVK